MNLLELFKPIRTFVFETDGVLTQETISVKTNGETIYHLNSKDVYALQTAISKGYKIWLVNDGDSNWLSNLHSIGINSVPHTSIKEISDHTETTHILYTGSEISALKYMQIFGLSCCPSDAVAEIKQLAQYTSPYQGGNGCIRDVVEKVLKLNGHWQ